MKIEDVVFAFRVVVIVAAAREHGRPSLSESECEFYDGLSEKDCDKAYEISKSLMDFDFDISVIGK